MNIAIELNEYRMTIGIALNERGLNWMNMKIMNEWGSGNEIDIAITLRTWNTLGKLTTRRRLADITSSVLGVDKWAK